MPIQFDSPNIVCSGERRLYPIKRLQEHTKNPPEQRLPYTKAIQSDLERFLIGSQYFEAYRTPTLQGRLYFWHPDDRTASPSRTISIPVQRSDTNGITITTVRRYEVYVDSVFYILGDAPPSNVYATIKVMGQSQAPVEVAMNFVRGGDYVWTISDDSQPAPASKTAVSREKLWRHLERNNYKIPLCFYWQLLKSQIEAATIQ
jgi:hypothetical protein